MDVCPFVPVENDDGRLFYHVQLASEETGRGFLELSVKRDRARVLRHAVLSNSKPVYLLQAAPVLTVTSNQVGVSV